MAKIQQDTYKDGTPMGEGPILDGKKHGRWRNWYRNGQLKAEGNFMRGEFDGSWRRCRENGELLQKGDFVDGRQNGFWQRWHDNGALMDEGMWRAGKRSGDWVYYTPDGSIRKNQTFRQLEWYRGEPSAGTLDTAAARLAAGSQVVLLRGGAPVVSALREDYALGHDRFEDVSELHRRCPAGGGHGAGRVKGHDA